MRLLPGSRSQLRVETYLNPYEGLKQPSFLVHFQEFQVETYLNPYEGLKLTPVNTLTLATSKLKPT